MTTIFGNGVAANCCAHLLDSAGTPVAIDRMDRPRVPTLLIGAATQALIQDVFGRDVFGRDVFGRDVFGRDDVFRAGHPVSRRMVAWGAPGTKPVEVPHSAVVISEAELTARLQSPSSPAAAASDIPHFPAHWTIHTGRSPVEKRGFGTRIAHAASVDLKSTCDRGACWIESLENGWLFLLPTASGAWLLSIGADAENLLANSRLIAGQIDSRIEPQTARFPAYPRISDPICGEDWLSCGSAAMAFDPICGDGAGNAIREAILASAVIRAAARGEDPPALLAHYRARLLAGFLRHLELCRPFYAACPGDWWVNELAQIDDGIVWCRAKLQAEPTFRFRLRGFELEPISSAAQMLP